jgi:hypothetical protein
MEVLMFFIQLFGVLSIFGFVGICILIAISGEKFEYLNGRDDDK